MSNDQEPRGSIRMPAIQSRDPLVMVPGGDSIAWPPDDDRLTRGARRALAFAQDEAASSNHNHVGPAHILVGLVREKEGLAARVFSDLGIGLDHMRSSFVSMMGRGDTVIAPRDITLIPSAKNVLERATYESRRLSHLHVGTEHLLLALLRDGQAFTSTILGTLGVERDDVRSALLATMQVPPSYGLAEHATPNEGPYENFAPESRRSLAFAQEEAVSFGHHVVGSEHLVLGLARVADAAAADAVVRRVFIELGLTLAQLRAEFVKLQPPRTSPAADRPIHFNAESKLIIELAMQVAGPDEVIRPQHILVAIGQAQGGIGGYLLAQLGATPDRVRTAVEKVDGTAA